LEDDVIEKPGRRRKPKDPTAAERQRRRRAKQREAEAVLPVPVTPTDPPMLPATVTPGLPMVIDNSVTSAVSPAWKRIFLVKRPAWSHGSHGVTSEAVTASRGGWWNAIGRGLAGITLIGVGIAIAATSMQANDWQGHILSVDKAAGDIFSRLSVLAELVACVLPTANQFYRDDGNRRAAMKGTVVQAVALLVVFFAASGFVLTNLSGAIEAKAERTTPTVGTAQRALDDAKGARDRECYGPKGEKRVGPVCRQREDEVTARQNELNDAKKDVKAGADPQAEAFHVTPATLRMARAGTMVLMCLAAGYIISLGWGLVFGRRRVPRTT
jgi:hypothetical protein